MTEDEWQQLSEHKQALIIANRWLDFKMNALTQMVPGDPDCDACVLARQFIRMNEQLDSIKRRVDKVTSKLGLSYAQTGGKNNDVGM